MPDILAIPSDACGCGACTAVQVTVASQTIVTGAQLFQGDGSPVGVAGIDPPPYPLLPARYDDRLTGIGYFWNITTQSWV